MLNHLLDGRFEEYLRSVRGGAKLWLFVHVPKTAGSSLASEFAANLRPYHNIHIDHTDQSRPAKERFDAATAAFLELARSRPFKSASGHMWQQHARDIKKEVKGTRMVTLLREPMSRLVSDYNYQRSPMHPLHREVIAKVPDFMAFAELPGPQNRMARHLVPMGMIRQGRLEESVDYARANFAFIGLQERYQLYFRLLTLLTTGRCKEPGAKQRVNEAKEEIVLPPDEFARVRELNRFDFAIYETVASLLGGVEAELEAWLNRNEVPAGKAVD